MGHRGLQCTKKAMVRGVGMRIPPVLRSDDIGIGIRIGSSERKNQTRKC